MIKEHQYKKCDCYEYNCPVCAGLCICEICDGAEGSLLSSCPGFKLNYETLEACYKGNVIDFTYIHYKIINGFNFKTKTWKY